MRRGLTFFEFVKYACNNWDDPAGDEFVESLFYHLKTDYHDGDCTKKAFTCTVCCFEQWLQDYGNYHFKFDEWLKDNDLTETITQQP